MVVFGAAFVLVGCSVATLSSPAPSSVPPAASTATTSPSPDPLNGLEPLSISEVLSQRAGGGLRDRPVAVEGFWSAPIVMHSCVPPTGNPGELEIYCHDGEWGMTERNEPIVVWFQNHRMERTIGPWLTPWISNEIAATGLFGLPQINGQFYPPIPIVVLGHFDDPRAADCRPEARRLCADRLVVDLVVTFDPDSVPTPAPTPSPTPFPYGDPPKAKFDAAICDGDIPYSFVGWTTMDDLGIDLGGEGHIFAMITRDVIRLSDWVDDPEGSGHRFRWWGQHVCYAWEWDESAVGFTTMPGTHYQEWDDGRKVPIEGP